MADINRRKEPQSFGATENQFVISPVLETGYLRRGPDSDYGLKEFGAMLTQGMSYDFADELGLTDPQNIEDIRARFPFEATATEIGGAIITGGGARKLGQDLIKRTTGIQPGALQRNLGSLGQRLDEIGTGATGGLVYGMGGEEGSATERAYDARYDALTGGAFPMALRLSLLGGKYVGSKIGGALQKLYNSMPITERSQANNVIKQALLDDNIDVEQLAENLDRLGDDATLADAGGDALLSNLEAVVNQSGPAGGMARDVFTQRSAGAATRVRNVIEKDLGKDTNFYDTVDAVENKMIAESKPLYDRAFGSNIVFDSPLLTRYSNIIGNKKGGLSPILTEALETQKNVDYARAQNAGTEINLEDYNLENIEGGILSLRQWDAVKRSIDGMLFNQDRKLFNRDGELKDIGKELFKFRKQLVDELDRLDTNGFYKQARDKWSGGARVKTALREGRRFLTGDSDLQIKDFMKLSPAERDAFRIGALRHLIDGIERKGTVPVSIKDVLNPESRIYKQMSTMFQDNDQFEKFINRMITEKRFGETSQRVLGGSQTARRIAGQEQQAEIDNSIPLASLAVDPTYAFPALIQSVQRTITRGDRLSKPVRTEIAKILTSTNREEQLSFLDQLNQELARQNMNPLNLNNLRQLIGAGIDATVPLTGPVVPAILNTNEAQPQ